MYAWMKIAAQVRVDFGEPSLKESGETDHEEDGWWRSVVGRNGDGQDGLVSTRAKSNRHCHRTALQQELQDQHEWHSCVLFHRCVCIVDNHCLKKCRTKPCDIKSPDASKVQMRCLSDCIYIYI